MTGGWFIWLYNRIICAYMDTIWLVVTGTMEWIMTFHSVGNVMIPIDYVFKDGLKPPTIFSPALNGFNEVRMSETVDKNEEGSQGSPQTQ